MLLISFPDFFWKVFAYIKHLFKVNEHWLVHDFTKVIFLVICIETKALLVFIILNLFFFLRLFYNEDAVYTLPFLKLIFISHFLTTRFSVKFMVISYVFLNTLCYYVFGYIISKGQIV